MIPEHLGACLAKLEECGVELDVKDQSITAYGAAPIRATRIRTAMYPRFATDLQQPFTDMLLRAHGRSIMTEKVYPKRFRHTDQLKRMGADIRCAAPAHHSGRRALAGNWVHAADIRAGVCLMIAGIMAEGKTRLTGVEHIERGYANAIDAFRALGAKMRLVEASRTRAYGEYAKAGSIFHKNHFRFTGSISNRGRGGKGPVFLCPHAKKRFTGQGRRVSGAEERAARACEVGETAGSAGFATAARRRPQRADTGNGTGRDFSTAGTAQTAARETGKWAIARESAGNDSARRTRAGSAGRIRRLSASAISEF